MFRRLFWFATGIFTGVWATTKVNRAISRLTPDSLAATAADRALELGGRARRFAHDVRAGMTQRERELTEALGLETSEDTEQASAARPALPGQRPRSPQITQNAYRQNPRDVQHVRRVYDEKEGH